MEMMDDGDMDNCGIVLLRYRPLKIDDGRLPLPLPR
jgi:hypothetical protein